MNLTKHAEEPLDVVDEVCAALSENPHEGLTREDIEGIEWDAYYVVSPEGGGSTDVEAFGRLEDGRWLAVEGWCDYTGWGCQDGADWFVHEDRQTVIDQGMTESMRGHLGLPKVLGGAS